VLSCDDVPARPVEAVGVDVGAVRFAGTSDGSLAPLRSILVAKAEEAGWHGSP